MKFRIKTNDPGCIEYFSNIVQMVAGLAKNVILHLNKGQLSFVIKERVVFGGITAWCDLEHAVLFSERICEGISPDQDEIFLELIMDHLLHCIRSNTLSTSNHNSLYSSSSTSNSCTTMNKSRIGSNSLTGNFDPSICRLLGLKIKLVRRKTPCLAIELEQSSVTGRSRSVWHFIPVQVVPPRLWDEFIEPPDPDFDIISANGSGELNFSINVESLACVKLTFRGLKARSWMLQESLLSEINDSMDEVRSTVWDSNDVDLDRSKQINDDPNKKLVSVSLDLRRISQLLSSPKIVPSCFVCNIIHEKLAQFLMLFDNHKLKFNIPASNL
ncbi:Checkpoint protein HUS1 [Schistosoma japonicum]|nr:Checkpoint protein HUS1 [Schistosoma japonicum]